MLNLTLLKKNESVKELSKTLGFTITLFDQDIVLIKADTKKELLTKSKKAQGMVILSKPSTEELLRFALEKTPVNVVYGMEFINPKDSVHFVRGGLDQVLCKIAASKGKIIAFSFSDILHSTEKSKLLARMMFNIKLCTKYKVKMVFGSFAITESELRSMNDLYSFWKVLGGMNKSCFDM